MESSQGRSASLLQLCKQVSTITALREIAIGVESLERSLALYGGVLDFETLRSGPMDPDAARMLGLGDARPDIATLGRPQVDDAPRLRLVETSESIGRSRADTAEFGPLGIGFTSADIEHTVSRLSAAGVDFLSPPIELTPDAEELTGPRRFEDFGQTADSEFLVIIERRNVPTPYGTLSDDWLTSEPLHTSHVVEDLAAASRFMVEALGHRVIFRETCSGDDFDRLMGLAPGALFHFEMLQHPDHHTGRIIFIEYVQPPASDAPSGRGRGIQALRYDCDDLDRTLENVIGAGGRLLTGPLSVHSSALGSGRVATVGSPIGTAVEIWQPSTLSR